MIETTVTCDMCGKKRDEKNHWFEGSVEVGQMVIWPFVEGGPLPRTSHLCGSSCVLKFVSERLGKL